MSIDDWLGLRGRAALIVGAGGLGGASALSLTAQGAQVVLVDRDPHRLAEVAARAEETGDRLQTLVADVGSSGASRAAVRAAAELVGTPAVFVI